MQNSTQTKTWYIQLAKATIALIGSMLKLTGYFFCCLKKMFLLRCMNSCCANIYACCLSYRRVDQNTYQPTTWQIKFNLDSVTPNSTYKFRVALASSALAELQVLNYLFPIRTGVLIWLYKLIHLLVHQVFFNDQNRGVPHFSTGLIGKDNAIARHGIHGLYWLFNIDVDSAWLVQGVNTIYLKQARSQSPFQGLMYDYLRLEGPCGC